MSKFGNDLIRSLKEALAHAKGNGPGTEHISESPRGPNSSDAHPDADGTTDNAN